MNGCPRGRGMKMNTTTSNLVNLENFAVNRVKYGPFISTAKGRQFYWDDPEFDIEEIAHALSLLCRFNGQCRHFYSVAEHSLLVSSMMEEMEWEVPYYEAAWEGLLHDAVEAYVGDTPAPMKQFVPDMVAIEDRIEKAFRAEYSMPDKKTELCKLADRAAALIEGQCLLPIGALDHWAVSKEKVETKLAEEFGGTIEMLTPAQAETRFLLRYEQLQKQIRAT